MKTPVSIVENRDCLEAMKTFPDKYFELAIVDPPYGIDAANMTLGLDNKKKFIKKGWDAAPINDDYFNELKRVSVNQIIWGGNYFNLPPTKCFLIWDKVNYGRSFAECEMAWTSFSSVARMFKCRHSNQFQEDKIHPTQKPIALYKWLLSNYAKEGDKILDTHLGSGSSRIAAYIMGFDFYGYELDYEYWLAQEKRFKEQTSQTQLFGYDKTA